ncbi:MAG: transcriptional regulator, GntR family with aminotransferase domain [Microbacterium sp.]|jgi:DNA-binding transcriptional MocR family regulator|nr:transcriptional regulator, GntR family with aminotransferase domain [Microbacterium sp.]
MSYDRADSASAWARSADIPDVSARGIASHVASLVRDGAIREGDVLPPVRVLAEELRVSPATVSAAWGLLKKRGMLVGSGKAGTRIASASGLVRGLEVFATVPGVNDLRLVYPDVALLPRLDDALRGAAQQPNLNEYYDSAILPGLAEAVEPGWPVPVDTFAVANGAVDAVWAVLRSLSVPGDRIIVETPTQPQILSLMLDLGLQPIPVAYVDGGVDTIALEQALRTRPVAMFFQPRAQVPTGWSISAAGRDAIAATVRGPHRPIFLEYDDLGDLARSPHLSIAERFPDHTVIIRSYEKAYGPDLRLAVMGGPEHLVRAAHAQIRLTRQWTSRILQSALEWMLRDEASARSLQEARSTYAVRLDRLVAELRARGVEVRSTDGLCAWIPVLDEVAAKEYLAGHGVLVLSGSSSSVNGGLPHIRAAVSRVPVEILGKLAEIIANATRVSS